MGEVVNEIESAIKTLNLNKSDINLIDDELGNRVFDEYENYFVCSKNRRWWWEDFKQDFFVFKDYEKPFEILKEIIPTAENVWFMVEDYHEAFYPIYDANPKIIGNVIAECFGFEYYIMDKNKEWLICENHHNQLFGIGKDLKARNLALIEREYNR
jgi:hypothetical protein